MKSTFLFLLFAFTLISTAQNPFIYGVASGDPLSDRVILWTKLAPSDPTQSIPVNWRIAADSDFNQITNSGSYTTDSSSDFTVKLDASGLQPNTWYYYDFEAGGEYSITGRTKTTPVGSVDNVRFAVATCAKYSKGYFNAYARIAERDDIDAVIHLGDYIYESDGSPNDPRPMMPAKQCTTLTDYRTRYKQYHSDADLVAARQQFPWINVWDDHETNNDSWEHGSEDWMDSTQFAAVKQAATKTYFEWIPMRQDSANPWRIYRQFQYGDLFDLIMLDTRREGREKQIKYDASNASEIDDPDRTLLGHEQFNWLTSKLSNSTAQWRVIGQQVMMAPALVGPTPFNEDQWDNYPAERTKLYDHILNNQISNVVVITGDVHAAAASDLPYDPELYVDATGEGSVAVEFITPAILSSESSFGNVSFDLIKALDPHIQYGDLSNGYMILDVTAEKVQGDFYYVAKNDTPDSEESLGASLYTLSGTRFLFRDTSVSSNFPNAPEVDFKVYPNPASETLIVEFSSFSKKDLNFKIFNTAGKRVINKKFSIPHGEQIVNIDISQLNNGIHVLQVMSGKTTLGQVKFMVEN